MPRARRTRTAAGKSPGKSVEALRHEQDTRTNIPTAEYQSLVREEQESPLRLAYQRRNRDLDPQLVWRGKDEQDLDDLVVNVPPLYIQEKVHPKVLIEDLVASSQRSVASDRPPDTDHWQLELFADFNGLPEGADRTEFYQHDGYWQNRMILGDSLQVMASLSEREGLQGKVQCIYIDPPYGIRFNSNFQWSTTDKDMRGNDTREHITREPEQVKAFRDTWRDGIHSYLTYLRDRFTVALELLTDSGSIFVQIGDENVHRVRALMDEVFGEGNFVSQISFAKTSGYATNFLTGVCDYILWYAKDRQVTKFRQPYNKKEAGETGATKYNRILLADYKIRSMTPSERSDPSTIPTDAKVWVDDNLTSQGNPQFAFSCNGKTFSGTYKTTPDGMTRLWKASRIYVAQGSFRFIRYIDDFSTYPANAAWMDIGGVQSRTDPKVYVVQTATEAIKRCILMTTDPGDLVLDPTCGSGTTAYVAEQWGRRWITIDTSRVALALARARIMGARYPYYILADSPEGQLKEAELSRRAPSEMPTYGNLRQGFVYERVPHITLRAIANNAEIDVIWEKYEEELAPIREQLSSASGRWSAVGGGPMEEWEIPRERPESWPLDTGHWLTEYWERRIARQREIDASIAARADYEYLYDKPYEDRSKVRVAGPFTVESISPHRVLGVDENGEVIDSIAEPRNGYGTGYDFGQVILENLKRSGVQQAHKEDRITFTSLLPWPGRFVCAEGRYEWPVASGQWSEDGGLDTDHPATDH